MSITTIPKQFSGTPTLTPAKIAALKNWYAVAVNDADVTTNPDYKAYYSGIADGMEFTLESLYDRTVKKVDVVTEAVKPMVKSHRITKLVVVGVVGLVIYLEYDRRQVEKRHQAAQKYKTN